MIDEMNEMLEQAIMNAIEELNRLPEGSEEKKRQAEVLEKLCRQRLDSWKIELDGMEQASRREIDREKNREDASIRKMQCAIEDMRVRMARWVRPDTLANLSGIIFLTLYVCKVEKEDMLILPRTLMNFIPKLKIF